MRELTPTVFRRRAAFLIISGAAVLAALTAPAPTGTAVVDALFTGALVAIVGWFARSASPGTVLVVAGATVVAAIGPGGAVWLAIAAWAISAVLHLIERADDEVVSAAVGSLIALAALRLPSHFVFGGSAVIAAALMAVVIVSGYRRASTRARRVTKYGAIFALELAVIAAGFVLATMVRSRHQLADSAGLLRSGIAAMNAGEIDSARTLFEQADERLEGAGNRLDAWWARVGAAVPVVAQHQRAARTLTNDAEELIDNARRAFVYVDPDLAPLTNGRFDVAAIDQMANPTQRLVAATTQLADGLESSDSPWLVEPATKRLDELRLELADNLPRLRTFEDVTELAGPLLGTERPARYLVAFLTPSEARPGGGYMGNYAELTIDNGALQLSKFGRMSDLLPQVADPARRILTGPEAYLERYAAFRVGDTETPAKTSWWQSVTIDPHFPHDADVMTQLYANGGNGEVDGVISIDPVGLAAVLRITGPVTLEDGTALSADNVVPYLLRTQYELVDVVGNAARAELLGDAAEAAFDQLLATNDVDPMELIRIFGDAIASGHVKMWSGDAELQSLFERFGADGSFAFDAPSDAIAVTNLNSGGNKLDAFLERSIDYTATLDPETRAITATATVTLRNTAPATGLSNYVIGSVVGDPDGTNRSYVSFYSRHELTRFTVDGVEQQPVEPAVGVQLGWRYVEWQVVIPPGGTTVLTYELSGSVPAGVPYSLEWWQPVTALPDQVTATVTTTSGEPVLGVVATPARTTRFRPDHDV